MKLFLHNSISFYPIVNIFTLQGTDGQDSVHDAPWLQPAIPASSIASASGAKSTKTTGRGSVNMVPFRDQEDNEMYTPANIRKRNELKKDRLIAKQINQIWLLLKKNSRGELERNSYMNLYIRLCKIFNPDFQFQEAIRVVSEDFNRDSKGARALTYEMFYDSLFELADLWCPDISAESYANLLEKVFRRITVKVKRVGGALMQLPPAMRTQPPSNFVDSTLSSDTLKALQQQIRDEEAAEKARLQEEEAKGKAAADAAAKAEAEKLAGRRKKTRRDAHAHGGNEEEGDHHDDAAEEEVEEEEEEEDEATRAWREEQEKAEAERLRLKAEYEELAPYIRQVELTMKAKGLYVPAPGTGRIEDVYSSSSTASAGAGDSTGQHGLGGAHAGGAHEESEVDADADRYGLTEGMNPGDIDPETVQARRASVISEAKKLKEAADKAAGFKAEAEERRRQERAKERARLVESVKAIESMRKQGLGASGRSSASSLKTGASSSNKEYSDDEDGDAYYVMAPLDDVVPLEDPSFTGSPVSDASSSASTSSAAASKKPTPPSGAPPSSAASAARRKPVPLSTSQSPALSASSPIISPSSSSSSSSTTVVAAALLQPFTTDVTVLSPEEAAEARSVLEASEQDISLLKSLPTPAQVLDKAMQLATATEGPNGPLAAKLAKSSSSSNLTSPSSSHPPHLQLQPSSSSSSLISPRNAEASKVVLGASFGAVSLKNKRKCRPWGLLPTAAAPTRPPQPTAASSSASSSSSSAKSLVRPKPPEKPPTGSAATVRLGAALRPQPRLVSNAEANAPRLRRGVARAAESLPESDDEAPPMPDDEGDIEERQLPVPVPAGIDLDRDSDDDEEAQFGGLAKPSTGQSGPSDVSLRTTAEEAALVARSMCTTELGTLFISSCGMSQPHVAASFASQYDLDLPKNVEVLAKSSSSSSSLSTSSSSSSSSSIDAPKRRLYSYSTMHLAGDVDLGNGAGSLTLPTYSEATMAHTSAAFDAAAATDAYRAAKRREAALAQARSLHKQSLEAVQVNDVDSALSLQRHADDLTTAVSESIASNSPITAATEIVTALHAALGTTQGGAADGEPASAGTPTNSSSASSTSSTSTSTSSAPTSTAPAATTAATTAANSAASLARHVATLAYCGIDRPHSVPSLLVGHASVSSAAGSTSAQANVPVLPHAASANLFSTTTSRALTASALESSSSTAITADADLPTQLAAATRALVHSTPSPLSVWLVGRPFTGKSTLAKSLQLLYGLVHITPDDAVAYALANLPSISSSSSSASGTSSAVALVGPGDETRVLPANLISALNALKDGGVLTSVHMRALLRYRLSSAQVRYHGYVISGVFGDASTLASLNAASELSGIWPPQVTAHVDASDQDVLLRISEERRRVALSLASLSATPVPVDVKAVITQHSNVIQRLKTVATARERATAKKKAKLNKRLAKLKAAAAAGLRKASHVRNHRDDVEDLENAPATDVQHQGEEEEEEEDEEFNGNVDDILGIAGRGGNEGEAENSEESAIDPVRESIASLTASAKNDGSIDNTFVEYAKTRQTLPAYLIAGVRPVFNPFVVSREESAAEFAATAAASMTGAEGESLSASAGDISLFSPLVHPMREAIVSAVLTGTAPSPHLPFVSTANSVISPESWSSVTGGFGGETDASGVPLVPPPPVHPDDIISTTLSNAAAHQGYSGVPLPQSSPVRLAIQAALAADPVLSLPVRGGVPLVPAAVNPAVTSSTAFPGSHQALTELSYPRSVPVDGLAQVKKILESYAEDTEDTLKSIVTSFPDVMVLNRNVDISAITNASNGNGNNTVAGAAELVSTLPPVLPGARQLITLSDTDSEVEQLQALSHVLNARAAISLAAHRKPITSEAASTLREQDPSAPMSGAALASSFGMVPGTESAHPVGTSTAVESTVEEVVRVVTFPLSNAVKNAEIKAIPGLPASSALPPLPNKDNDKDDDDEASNAVVEALEHSAANAAYIAAATQSGFHFDPDTSKLSGASGTGAGALPMGSGSVGGSSHDSPEVLAEGIAIPAHAFSLPFVPNAIGIATARPDFSTSSVFQLGNGSASSVGGASKSSSSSSPNAFRSASPFETTGVSKFNIAVDGVATPVNEPLCLPLSVHEVEGDQPPMLCLRLGQFQRYCPVSLLQEGRLVRGVVACVHESIVYFFASPVYRERFIENPALYLTAPPSIPSAMVVLLVGCPASGKTTFARRLAVDYNFSEYTPALIMSSPMPGTTAGDDEDTEDHGREHDEDHSEGAAEDEDGNIHSRGGKKKRGSKGAVVLPEWAHALKGQRVVFDCEGINNAEQLEAFVSRLQAVGLDIDLIVHLAVTDVEQLHLRRRAAISKAKKKLTMLDGASGNSDASADGENAPENPNEDEDKESAEPSLADDQLTDTAYDFVDHGWKSMEAYIKSLKTSPPCETVDASVGVPATATYDALLQTVDPFYKYRASRMPKLASTSPTPLSPYLTRPLTFGAASYCPVSLLDLGLLIPGRPHFAVTFASALYHLHSVEAVGRFFENPRRYHVADMANPAFGAPGLSTIALKGAPGPAPLLFDTDAISSSSTALATASSSSSGSTRVLASSSDFLLPRRVGESLSLIPPTRVMLVGPTASGKSSLAKALLPVLGVSRHIVFSKEVIPRILDVVIKALAAADKAEAEQRATIRADRVRRRQVLEEREKLLEQRAKEREERRQERRALRREKAREEREMERESRMARGETVDVEAEEQFALQEEEEAEHDYEDPEDEADEEVARAEEAAFAEADADEPNPDEMTSVVGEDSTRMRSTLLTFLRAVAGLGPQPKAPAPAAAAGGKSGEFIEEADAVERAADAIPPLGLPGLPLPAANPDLKLLRPLVQLVWAKHLQAIKTQREYSAQSAQIFADIMEKRVWARVRADALANAAHIAAAAAGSVGAGAAGLADSLDTSTPSVGGVAGGQTPAMELPREYVEALAHLKENVKEMERDAIRHGIAADRTRGVTSKISATAAAAAAVAAESLASPAPSAAGFTPGSPTPFTPSTSTTSTSSSTLQLSPEELLMEEARLAELTLDGKEPVPLHEALTELLESSWLPPATLRDIVADAIMNGGKPVLTKEQRQNRRLNYRVAQRDLLLSTHATGAPAPAPAAGPAAGAVGAGSKSGSTSASTATTAAAPVVPSRRADGQTDLDPDIDDVLTSATSSSSGFVLEVDIACTALLSVLAQTFESHACTLPHLVLPLVADEASVLLRLRRDMQRTRYQLHYNRLTLVAAEAVMRKQRRQERRKQEAEARIAQLKIKAQDANEAANSAEALAKRSDSTTTGDSNRDRDRAAEEDATRRAIELRAEAKEADEALRMAILGLAALNSGSSSSSSLADGDDGESSGENDGNVSSSSSSNNRTNNNRGRRGSASLSSVSIMPNEPVQRLRERALELALSDVETAEPIFRDAYARSNSDAMALLGAMEGFSVVVLSALNTMHKEEDLPRLKRVANRGSLLASLANVKMDDVDAGTKTGASSAAAISVSSVKRLTQPFLPPALLRIVISDLASSAIRLIHPFLARMRALFFKPHALALSDALLMLREGSASLRQFGLHCPVALHQARAALLASTETAASSLGGGAVHVANLVASTLSSPSTATTSSGSNAGASTNIQRVITIGSQGGQMTASVTLSSAAGSLSNAASLASSAVALASSGNSAASAYLSLPDCLAAGRAYPVLWHNSIIFLSSRQARLAFMSDVARFIHEPPVPPVVPPSCVVVGPRLSGKTALARTIANATGMKYLDMRAILHHVVHRSEIILPLALVPPSSSSSSSSSPSPSASYSSYRGGGAGRRGRSSSNSGDGDDDDDDDNGSSWARKGTKAVRAAHPAVARTRTPTTIGMVIASLLEDGKPIPPAILVLALKSVVSSATMRTSGWVLDGFPNTAAQAQLMHQLGTSPLLVLSLRLGLDTHDELRVMQSRWNILAAEALAGARLSLSLPVAHSGMSKRRRGGRRGGFDGDDGDYADNFDDDDDDNEQHSDEHGVEGGNAGLSSIIPVCYSSPAVLTAAEALAHYSPSFAKSSAKTFSLRPSPESLLLKDLTKYHAETLDVPTTFSHSLDNAHTLLVNSSAWSVSQTSLGLINLRTAFRTQYIRGVQVNRAALLGLTPVSRISRRALRTHLRAYCPVEWLEHQRLVKNASLATGLMTSSSSSSDAGVGAADESSVVMAMTQALKGMGLHVQVDGHIYQLSTPAALRRFLASPHTYTTPAKPLPLPSIRPRRLQLIDCHRVRNEHCELAGACPVALVKARRRGVVNIVPGKANCVIAVGGKLYRLSSERAAAEFLENFESFIKDASLPQKLPPSAQPLPGLGTSPADDPNALLKLNLSIAYLESTVANILTQALSTFDRLRVVYPGLTPSQSAQVYLALLLKARNPVAPPALVNEYELRLARFLSTCSLVPAIANAYEARNTLDVGSPVPDVSGILSGSTNASSTSKQAIIRDSSLHFPADLVRAAGLDASRLRTLALKGLRELAPDTHAVAAAAAIGAAGAEEGEDGKADITASAVIASSKAATAAAYFPANPPTNISERVIKEANLRRREWETLSQAQVTELLSVSSSLDPLDAIPLLVDIPDVSKRLELLSRVYEHIVLELGMRASQDNSKQAKIRTPSQPDFTPSALAFHLAQYFR